MDELRLAIDALLRDLPNHVIGEYVKVDDVTDWLLDLQLLVVKEPVPV